MTEALFEMPRSAYAYRSCLVCGGASTVTLPYTYVVQRQWWVKIGATNNPRRRINELSRPAWAQYVRSPVGMDWAEPLLVHRIIDGDIEHALHEVFADDHVIGEWFEPSPRLRGWLLA